MPSSRSRKNRKVNKQDAKSYDYIVKPSYNLNYCTPEKETRKERNKREAEEARHMKRMREQELLQSRDGALAAKLTHCKPRQLKLMKKLKNQRAKYT